MRLSALFARRYLFSPKSHSVINIISVVSAVAVGVPVAAMVILLSVFNGFEGLVRGMYGEFDPDILVTPTTGKVFDSLPDLSVEGVECVSYVLEDEVLLGYRGRQREATLRGVDSVYHRVVPIAGMVEAGEWELQRGEMEQAVLGAGVAYDLGLNLYMIEPVEVWVPRRGSVSSVVPVDLFRTRELWPAGIFALDADTDGRYVLAPIGAVRALLDYPDGVSAAMVRVAAGAVAGDVQARLREVVPGAKVQTRYEQKASFYAIMTYEKWGIFLIILLVMVIASFAIVGSLVMLVIDKREDLRTIAALGGDVGFVRGIFVREGMLISGLGAAGGLILGLGVCLVQQAFGVVRIPARTFLVEAYPVVVRAEDVALVVASFFVVNFIITKFTVRNAIPR